MEILKTHFEQKEVWNRDRYLEDVQEVNRFTETLKLIPKDIKNLVDVGTGNGAFLWFLENSSFTAKFEGLEYTLSGITNKVCKAKINQGEIQNIDFKDDSFDIVSCLEVIEHLPISVYKKGLLELERISKKYILISVPYQESRTNVICPNCNCEFNPNTHVRSFDKNRLLKLFNNFELSELHEVGEQKDFFISNSRLQNEFRRIFARNSFRANLHCPQCGFSKNNQFGQITTTKHYNKLATIKTNLIKTIFFFKTKPRWYVALYKKK